MGFCTWLYPFILYKPLHCTLCGKYRNVILLYKHPKGGAVVNMLVGDEHTPYFFNVYVVVAKGIFNLLTASSGVN